MRGGVEWGGEGRRAEDSTQTSGLRAKLRPPGRRADKGGGRGNFNLEDKGVDALPLPLRRVSGGLRRRINHPNQHPGTDAGGGVDKCNVKKNQKPASVSVASLALHETESNGPTLTRASQG